MIWDVLWAVNCCMIYFSWEMWAWLRLNSIFQRGLYLEFDIMLNTSYCTLHGLFNQWHSVESFASLSRTCIECMNFQRGLYLKLSYLHLIENPWYGWFYEVFNRIISLSQLCMCRMSKMHDYHNGCITLSKCNKYVMLTTTHIMDLSHKGGVTLFCWPSIKLLNVMPEVVWDDVWPEQN